MEKKYQIKGTSEKQKNSKSADGTENSEHILDILANAKVLYSNIQDNFDIAATMFKLNKKESDEDILDALQIECESMAEIENEAGIIIQSMENFQERLEEINQDNLEVVYQKLQELETKSKTILERILKV